MRLLLFRAWTYGKAHIKPLVLGVFVFAVVFSVCVSMYTLRAQADTTPFNQRCAPNSFTQTGNTAATTQYKQCYTYDKDKKEWILSKGAAAECKNVDPKTGSKDGKTPPVGKENVNGKIQNCPSTDSPIQTTPPSGSPATSANTSGNQSPANGGTPKPQAGAQPTGTNTGTSQENTPANTGAPADKTSTDLKSVEASIGDYGKQTSQNSYGVNGFGVSQTETSKPADISTANDFGKTPDTGANNNFATLGTNPQTMLSEGMIASPGSIPSNDYGVITATAGASGFKDQPSSTGTQVGTTIGTDNMMYSAYQAAIQAHDYGSLQNLTNSSFPVVAQLSNGDILVLRGEDYHIQGISGQDGMTIASNGLPSSSILYPDSTVSQVYDWLTGKETQPLAEKLANIDLTGNEAAIYGSIGPNGDSLAKTIADAQAASAEAERSVLSLGPGQQGTYISSTGQLAGQSFSDRTPVPLTYAVNPPSVSIAEPQVEKIVIDGQQYTAIPMEPQQQQPVAEAAPAAPSPQSPSQQQQEQPSASLYQQAQSQASSNQQIASSADMAKQYEETSQPAGGSVQQASEASSQSQAPLQFQSSGQDNAAPSQSQSTSAGGNSSAQASAAPSSQSSVSGISPIASLNGTWSVPTSTPSLWQQALTFLANLNPISSATAQPYEVTSGQALTDAVNSACKVTGCNAPLIQKAMGGVCAIESGCDSNAPHPGSQYQGFGQMGIKDGPQGQPSETKRAISALYQMSQSPNLSSTEQDKARAAADAAQGMMNKNQNPNKDTILGPWLLVGLHVSLGTLPKVSAITNDPQKAAAYLENAQLAPATFNGSFTADKQLGSGARWAYNAQRWMGSFSPGTTVGQAAERMLGAVGNKVSKGVAFLSQFIPGASPAPIPASYAGINSSTPSNPAYRGGPTNPTKKPGDSGYVNGIKRIDPNSIAGAPGGPVHVAFFSGLNEGSIQSDAQAQSNIGGKLPAGATFSAPKLVDGAFASEAEAKKFAESLGDHPILVVYSASNNADKAVDQVTKYMTQDQLKNVKIVSLDGDYKGLTNAETRARKADNPDPNAKRYYPSAGTDHAHLPGNAAVGEAVRKMAEASMPPSAPSSSTSASSEPTAKDPQTGIGMSCDLGNQAACEKAFRQEAAVERLAQSSGTKIPQGAQLKEFKATKTSPNDGATTPASSLPTTQSRLVENAPARTNQTILKAASEASKYLPPGYTVRVTPNGGYRASPSLSGSMHGRTDANGNSMAVDFQIYDANGQAVPNIRSPQNFQLYREFAQNVRASLPASYQNTTRWGGYFVGGVANDMMHIDFGGTAMAAGSWEHGLNAGHASYGAPGQVGQGMGNISSYKMLAQAANGQSAPAAPPATYDITDPATGQKVASNIPLSAGTVGADGVVNMLANADGKPLGKDGQPLTDGGQPLAAISDATLPKGTWDPTNNNYNFTDDRPIAPTPSGTSLAGGNGNTFTSSSQDTAQQAIQAMQSAMQSMAQAAQSAAQNAANATQSAINKLLGIKQPPAPLPPTLACTPHTTSSNEIAVTINVACSVGNVSTLSFSDLNINGAQGSVDVPLPINTSSILPFVAACVSGSQWSDIRSCTITTAQPGIAFTANPGTIYPEDEAQLTWAAVQVSQCKLTTSDGTFAVDTSGSTSTTALIATTPFTLTCKKSDGTFVTATTTVQVTGN